MEAVFQAPKRRARVYEVYEAPLPVLTFDQDAAHRHHLVFKAELINNHVIVRHPDYIQSLYSKGYFGKGILSRSRPEHSLSERWKNHGDLYLPIISHSRYQTQVQLAQEALQAQGLEEEVVDQTLERLSQPVEFLVTESGKDQENGHAETPLSPHGQENAESYLDTTVHFLDSSSKAPSGNERLSDAYEGAGENPPEAKRPRRQGNPVHDPLASLYPEEPKQLDQKTLSQIRCLRHDDWIVHCGCRLRDSQLEAATQNKAGVQGVEYVLVEEQDDNEESTSSLRNVNTRANGTGKLVCRINPFRITEYLQLSLEEAFFLVYALGCLSIYDHEEPLSIVQMWEMFRSMQPNFETTYVAYHYFRSKGWIPKTGVKYGSDFMLYRKGPPFYHASYSVVVERVDESFKGATLRPFSWRSLAALSRITGNVSKELMFCYVVIPLNMAEEMLCSPECIKKIKVQEIILSRWISSRERTDQDEI
ncbi:tRNA-splicing endonuclease subunit Sen2 isoform X1 [Alosa sapidissima]|uniref:tRNA-splicing endonuclease subunit Sen2 isoform X1 n=1 Tax=Alosa sapidissima TaxID=34773 RepID=UPI001C095B4C|nr:tRNA-splicing endonuclease subunit Sen2 isoform X1 [Alosa sapidissima]